MFYKKRYNKSDAALVMKEVREFLIYNAKRIIDLENAEESPEWYFLPHSEDSQLTPLDRLGPVLQNAGFMRLIRAENGLYVLINEENSVATPTVTPTHIRLPKISHLITLTPEDMFVVLRLIAASQSVNHDSLKLNLVEAEVFNINHPMIDTFFELLITNYRLNSDYASPFWTPRSAIERVATLLPTRENQLSAIQYLIALQDPKILYFPTETVVELELDWQQITEDYCIPNEEHKD